MLPAELQCTWPPPPGETPRDLCAPPCAALRHQAVLHRFAVSWGHSPGGYQAAFSGSAARAGPGNARLQLPSLPSGSSAFPLEAMLLLSCMTLNRISSLTAHLCPTRPQNSALPGGERGCTNAQGWPCPRHLAGEPYLTSRVWGSDACAAEAENAFLGGEERPAAGLGPSESRPTSTHWSHTRATTSALVC